MKIKGPSEGPTRVGETEALGDVGATEAPAAVGAVRPATGVTTPDAVAAVASRLRAGEIDVQQAVELLIDDAIERQVGRAVEARQEIEGKLREMLREYTAEDPFLAGKV